MGEREVCYTDIPCTFLATPHDMNLRFFYVLLTVHLSINLVNDQLDAQFFYFKIRLLLCFEKRRAHHQEVKLY